MLTLAQALTLILFCKNLAYYRHGNKSHCPMKVHNVSATIKFCIHNNNVTIDSNQEAMMIVNKL
jgi:hypothetical protein